MVINPTEILGEIKLLLKRNEDHNIHSMTFPAIDVKDSDHNLFEFCFDKLEAWNEKFAFPDELAVNFRKIASINIRAEDKELKKRLKNKNIFDLDSSTINENGTPIFYEAKFELGLYEFNIDSNQIYDNEEYNVKKLMSEISNFISIIIISSIQIAAVLTKYNINPNFYNDFYENYNNPILATFQKFFNEEFTDSFPKEEFSEYMYLDISDIIDYIFEMQVSKSPKCLFLLSYFPLFVANFNHDILTEEDIGIKLKPKNKEKRSTAIDLMNLIMEDQEG